MAVNLNKTELKELTKTALRFYLEYLANYIEIHLDEYKQWHLKTYGELPLEKDIFKKRTGSKKGYHEGCSNDKYDRINHKQAFK